MASTPDIATRHERRVPSLTFSAAIRRRHRRSVDGGPRLAARLRTPRPAPRRIAPAPAGQVSFTHLVRVPIEIGPVHLHLHHRRFEHHTHGFTTPPDGQASTPVTAPPARAVPVADPRTASPLLLPVVPRSDPRAAGGAGPPGAAVTRAVTPVPLVLAPNAPERASEGDKVAASGPQPPSAPLIGPASAVDVTGVADRVLAILDGRLLAQRERRGVL